MNLEQFIAQVEENLGRDDKTGVIPTWVNLGLQKINKDFVFKGWIKVANADLESDSRTIVLPSIRNLYSVKLVNGSGRNLIRISPEDYDEHFPDAFENAATGEPKYYTRWGNALEFYPKSSQSYKIYIRYAATPTELVDPTDQPEIPHDGLIVAAATERAFMALQLPEDAHMWERKYMSELRSAVRAEQTADADYTPRLKPFRLPGMTATLTDHRYNPWV